MAGLGSEEALWNCESISCCEWCSAGWWIWCAGATEAERLSIAGWGVSGTGMLAEPAECCSAGGGTGWGRLAAAGMRSWRCERLSGLSSSSLAARCSGVGAQLIARCRLAWILQSVQERESVQGGQGVSAEMESTEARARADRLESRKHSSKEAHQGCEMSVLASGRFRGSLRRAWCTKSCQSGE